MEVLLIKLDGWPDIFNERIEALSKSVDRISVVRPKQAHSHPVEQENVEFYDLLPSRDVYVPAHLHLVIFPFYILQAIVISAVLIITRRIRPDVIHCLNQVIEPIVGAILSRLFSIPLVVSVRGLMQPRYGKIVENNPSSIVRVNYIVVKIILHLGIPRADHIITKAKYQQEYIRDTYSTNPGFTTVPTGVDFEKFDCERLNDKEVAPDRLREGTTLFDNGKTNIVFLGKLTPEKGVGRLIELVAESDSELPDNIQFTVIGEFRSPDYESEIKSKIAEIENRITLYPRLVPFNAVPHILCAADGVVLLSTPNHEGTPRILQEACASGTPIIASDVSGIRGAFSDLPGCHLIDRNSVGDFMSAVSVIKESGDIDRSVFREKFDIERNYKVYADVYASLQEASKAEHI